MIRYTGLQYSAIGRAELQQRIQPQGSITWLNRIDWYIPVQTRTYQYILSCTFLYCSLYQHVSRCILVYLLVPPCTGKYLQVHTSTYQYILSCTSLYCSLYHHVPPCTSLYLLVPPCTGKYIPVHTSMYCHRNVIGQYKTVRTSLYNFDFSCTALHPEEDVLVRTRTYHLVLPCTRGTGFQMRTRADDRDSEPDYLLRPTWHGPGGTICDDHFLSGSF